MTFPLPQPMRRALDLARTAASLSEVPIGAVVVCDGTIVGEGHNLTRTLRDPTAHAEIVAIRAACKALASERLSGCQMFVTLEPCAMCAGAIIHARFARVTWAAPDPKGGGVVHGARVFASPACLHRPELIDGMGEAEASTLLRDFFVTLRS